MPLFRRRDHEAEEHSSYGEKHAERVIRRVDEITDELELVVKELKAISRRFGSEPE